MDRDIAQKRLEDYNDVFADIFNNLVFHGNQILEEDRLEPFPTEAFTRKIDGGLRQGNGDVRKVDRRNGRYRLIYGTENQDGPDNTMPERIMGYEFAAYEEQIKEFMARNEQEGNRAYGKRIHDNQRLAPVVTVVLYFGGANSWQGPRHLHDMLEFPAEIEEKIKPFVADYPMNLVDLSKVPKEVRQRMTSDFRFVVEYLACRNHPAEMKKFMSDNERVIRHPVEFLDVMSELASDARYRRIRDQLMEQERAGHKKEDLTMWKIEDEIENRGIEKGIKQGEWLKMIFLIRKKCQKGKDLRETAEDLEEDVSMIRPIYELISLHPEMGDAEILSRYQALKQ